MAEKQKRYIMVTTDYRGVFFGELKHISADKREVTLLNARCAIKWNTTKGIAELACDGPNSNSKIGSVAPEVTLLGVHAIFECSPKAVQEWQKHS